MDKHWTLTIVTTAVLLMAGGCQPIGEDFEPEGAERSVHRFASVQAASGARADAMLQPYHFDGGELNALGERKLDRMLADDDALEPMVVYLHVRDDERTNDRRAAVVAYLKDGGLADEQIRIELGDNPGSRHSVTPGLAAMTRLNATPSDTSANEAAEFGRGFGEGYGGSMKNKD